MPRSRARQTWAHPPPSPYTHTNGTSSVFAITAIQLLVTNRLQIPESQKLAVLVSLHRFLQVITFLFPLQARIPRLESPGQDPNWALPTQEHPIHTRCHRPFRSADRRTLRTVWSRQSTCSDLRRRPRIHFNQDRQFWSASKDGGGQLPCHHQSTCRSKRAWRAPAVQVVIRSACTRRGLPSNPLSFVNQAAILYPLSAFLVRLLSFNFFSLYVVMAEESQTGTDSETTDPSLIQPFSPLQAPNAQYPEPQTMHSPHNMAYPAPSPVPSRNSVRSPRSSIGKMHTSPHSHAGSYQPYPAFAGSRRPSVSSVHSRHSQASSSDESSKGLCPYPTCGRHFKDLKAHMLTHQNERPEKCPIPTCEYHTKGFARKYDKNRHTLTHYKGTMVCNFCPGSGSSAEKSFNRADVFKRHLTSVQGVEQTQPNARRKSTAGGKQEPKSNVRDVSGM